MVSIIYKNIFFFSKNIIQDFCYFMEIHLHCMQNRQEVFLKSGVGMWDIVKQRSLL